MACAGQEPADRRHVRKHATDLLRHACTHFSAPPDHVAAPSLSSVSYTGRVEPRRAAQAPHGAEPSPVATVEEIGAAPAAHT
jgi:hypothetical protein